MGRGEVTVLQVGAVERRRPYSSRTCFNLPCIRLLRRMQATDKDMISQSALLLVMSSKTRPQLLSFRPQSTLLKMLCICYSRPLTWNCKTHYTRLMPSLRETRNPAKAQKHINIQGARPLNPLLSKVNQQ